MSKNWQRRAQERKTSKKMAPKSEKSDPKGNFFFFRDGIREPSLEELRSVNSQRKALVRFAFYTQWGPRTPAHCLRFAHPAEADWRLGTGKFGELHFGGILTWMGHPV